MIHLCGAGNPDMIAGGIHDPDCGDLDVAAIHAGYLRGFRGRGGRLVANAALTGPGGTGFWIILTSLLADSVLRGLLISLSKRIAVIVDVGVRDSCDGGVSVILFIDGY